MLLEKYEQFNKNGRENETILKIKKLDGSSWPLSPGLVQKTKKLCLLQDDGMFLRVVLANI